MKILGDRIILTFTAGEALSEGDAVYISSAGTEKKADNTNIAKVVGVADAAAASGASVDVVVYGKKTVVADGSIDVGDRVVAASTAGRVVAGNSYTTPAHSHISAVVKNSETAGDETSFVDLYDGQGNAPSPAVKVAAPGGGSDINLFSGFASPSVEQGRILGKALSAASSAGDTLDILVCLA